MPFCLRQLKMSEKLCLQWNDFKEYLSKAKELLIQLVSRFPCCISFIFVALIFVLKYSRRWRPPIGGCKKFEPQFRPEMSNLIHLFCIIPLPHTFCPTKTRFHPLWSTPEPPGASSLGTSDRCSSIG